MNISAFLLIVYFSVTMLIIDLVFRFSIIRTFSTENLIFYGLSAILSFLFWLVIVDLFFFLRKFGKIFFSVGLAVLSLFYALLIIGSYTYFRFSKILPNYFTISYMIQEPLNSFTLMRDGAGFLGLALLFISSSILFIFIKLVLKKKEKVVLWKFSLAFLVASVTFPFLIHNTRYRDQVYIADTSGYSFIVRAAYNELTGDKLGSAGLQSRTPQKLNVTYKVTPKFNVIMVIAESLRKKSMSIYGYTRDTTPNLREFSFSKSKNLFLFRNAFSNATSTLISLPSILTGVLPNESTARIHNYPIFWEFGKAKGYSTFYITSHDHKWNNLKGYFENAGIDYLWNRDSFSGPLFNDLGVDDRETLKELKKHIGKLAKSNQNFLGVFHLNTNHFPYLHPKEFEKWEKEESYDFYDNSVLFFDSVMGDFFKYLRSTKLDKNTVVIFTSDHGESVGEHGYFGHIESNYIETISIPLFLYIPPKVQKILKLNRNEIQKNLSKNVMNGDILPTVIDILDPANQSGWSKNKAMLTGKSLLGNIPENREIFIVNNNEISLYKVGFSLIKNNLHYIYNIIAYPTDEELYDLNRDLDELKNIWATSGQELRSNIAGSFQKCKICETVRSKKK